MKNIINIQTPIILKNRIEYKYEVDGEWKEIFQKKFFIEYNYDISEVPESIAIIPFICNILPIAWLYDAQINIKDCDENFFESIDNVKQGYMEMYPQLNFKGKIETLIKTKNIIKKPNGALTFFSGGVDAFNTLLNHINEKPTLVTIWGADIKLSDEKGWNNVFNHISETAKDYGLNYIIIKSSLRECFNNEKLHELAQKANENWWHGFQHGIGIISHAAPIAYLMGIKNIYFASSFTKEDKGKVTCASDPTIDNYLKISDTTVIHDGYEFCRQDKIHNIVNYCNKNNKKIKLRVCWQSSGGKNCCHCEKCWRTMLGIYAENANPRDYDFKYTNKDLRKMKYCNSPSFNKIRYEPIQRAMHKNVEYKEVPKKIKWFYKIDINKLNYHPLYNFMRKIKRRLMKK